MGLDQIWRAFSSWVYLLFYDFDNEDSSQIMYKGTPTKCLSGSSCLCNPAIKIESDIGCVISFRNLSVKSKVKT